MCIVDQVKKIATYICEAFEDWDLDDPVEEGYLEDYQEISGASEEEIQEFEKKLGTSLPDALKEVYRYKNGSKFLAVLPCVIDQREMAFSLMSLQEIEDGKRYFQNRDSLLTEFPDYFSSQDVEEMRDSRVKPYLFNKKWLPFAEYCDSCYLMLGFNPDQEGQEGQIICYSHAPDEIIYVAKSFTELIEGIMEVIV